MTELTIKEKEEKKIEAMNPFKKVDFKEVRDFVGLISQEIDSKEWKGFFRKWYYKHISK